MADEYSSWVGLIYVFNLIVGTGALTLPAVFAGAGWLLSTILVSLLALVSFITVTFVIETMACANATVHWRLVQSHKIDESEVPADSDSELDNTTEETAIMSINRLRKRYYTLNTKVELGEMAKLYFNKPGQILFYVSLCVYLYGDLAIYATAISKTIVDLACNKSYNDSENYDVKCWDSSEILKINMYRIFVAIFALLVGPFTYFKIQKTKYLQIFTTTLRWSAFIIMITLACARLSKYGQEGHPHLFYLNGIPGLIGSTMTGSFAFKNLEDLYTLNFIPTESDNSGVFMEIIKYFLGAFPLFTLSTSFPIIAITLQNNLKSLFLDVNVMERYNFFIRRLAFPTLAVVPPVVVAFCIHNLRTLVAITGSYAGVLIQYIIPACLVYSCRKHCTRDIGNYDNKYASPFKHVFWFIFVIGWSIMCVIFVTVNFIIRELDS
ncbi:transmembrane protein 104 -like [Asbolus verrucosus]|uniref:Transmembrane protein 104-like n=1 Tax=Asbolus verrucosus TaxID=1661398 RepID=A0A482W536_ASBVE|nr:transmembrane protein 104 -like [Asbolus verrucosus]